MSTNREESVNYKSYKKSVTTPPGAEKPLPKMTIDGAQVEFMPGDTIMQVAERANLAHDIPRYCYHPGLPIAGTCRMCTVEVEKAPKLMTSCSTPAADGMIVHTQTDKVKKSRTGVMEFLLTNHPLDCPVCDKAGECELQDYNYEYGPGTSRFKEDKRVWENASTKKLSDKITLNMNRCVHCERCVRFSEDVTKTYDLVMLNRGYRKELVTPDEKGLTSDYQGCLTDFCPVGALTFNDFRFQKRSWFLKKSQSICDGCSKGCNVEVHYDNEIVYRLVPTFNEKVNGHWMCDEGRVSYHGTTALERVVNPLIMGRNAGGEGLLNAVDWQTALMGVKEVLHSKNNPTILGLIGTDTSSEEAKLIDKKLKGYNPQVRLAFYNGTNGVMSSKDDQKIDNLLRQKDKTSNTVGLEKLGLKHASENDLSGSIATVVYFRFGRAKIPHFKNIKNLVLVGVFQRNEILELQKSNVVHALLPGLTTLEKNGTYTNCDSIEQTVSAAVKHRGHALEVEKIFAMMGE